MRKLKSSIMVTAALSLALPLAACSSEDGAGESEAAGELVVGVYGGEWEENIRPIIEEFAEETGTDVEIVAGADAQWFTQLRASDGENPQYDVLILQPDTIQRAAADDLLEPLTEENVPNLANLYDSIQSRLTIDGEQYATGFSVGQLGLAYRTDLVPEEPTAWLDLWNPAYEGHVAISSPSYSAGLQFLSGLINAQGGEESNPEDVDQAFEQLGELRDSVVAYPDNPGAIQTLLERGDAWVVPFWDGRIFALQESGLDNIGFVYPEEGAVAAVASWAVTAGTNNEEAAYALVDYLSSAEVQAEFSELTYYGMTNENVEYSEALQDRVQVGEEAYNALKWVDYETATPNLAEWTNRWTQELGGS